MKHNTESDLRLPPSPSANIPHSPTFAKVFRECAQDAARDITAAGSLYEKGLIARDIQRMGKRFAVLTSRYAREIQLSRNFAEVWKS